MIPFRVSFQSGAPAHEQVAFAAKKAIISGKLRPGDPFPSVRTLSKAVKIHFNTAQKVIAQLQRLLAHDVEQLTVEAIKLGVSLEELQEQVAEQWRKLQHGKDREKS